MKGRPYSSKARVPTELILLYDFAETHKNNTAQKIRCSWINSKSYNSHKFPNVNINKSIISMAATHSLESMV